MNNNNETTIKKSAKRSRYGLRISYEDLKTLIDYGSRELSDRLCGGDRGVYDF